MTTQIINHTINTTVMNPGAAVASSTLVSKSEKPVVLNSTPAELTSAQADSLYAPQTEALPQNSERGARSEKIAYLVKQVAMVRPKRMFFFLLKDFSRLQPLSAPR